MSSRIYVSLIGIVIAGLTILPGLSYAKSSGTFLNGPDKPGIFYCWGFGLWFSLQLLRYDRTFVRRFGQFSFGLFGLLLIRVILTELELLLGR
ncbi:hypothetical protein GC207_05655 [bacterium]|nr:hypothetical protein [bacterium]